MWQVWVELKVEVGLELEVQLVKALSSYVRTASPTCVMGRRADWQIAD